MTFLSIIQNIALCFGIYFIIILFPWVFAIFSQKHSEIDNLNTPLKSKTRKKTYSYNNFNCWYMFCCLFVEALQTQTYPSYECLKQSHPFPKQIPPSKLHDKKVSRIACACFVSLHVLWYFLGGVFLGVLSASLALMLSCSHAFMILCVFYARVFYAPNPTRILFKNDFSLAPCVPLL